MNSIRAYTEIIIELELELKLELRAIHSCNDVADEIVSHFDYNEPVKRILTQ